MKKSFKLVFQFLINQVYERVRFFFLFFFDTPCSARIFMLLLAKLSLLLKETDFPQVKTDIYDCKN